MATPGASAPGGATLPTHHGKTARSLLKIDWRYPVYQVKHPGGPAKSPGGTVAKAVQSALPEREAFLYLSGEDRRPLLVLRECKTCNGTDKALLTSGEDNTRTFVMSRWFQCIKLPTDVVTDNHPFHALFDEEHPPHLFVCRWDGSEPVTLKGDQSRTELWAAMNAMIERSYVRDADVAVAEVEKIIAQYDVMDARIDQIERAIEKIAEDEGPKSKKMKALEKDLQQARRDLEDLKRREKAASDLGLKPEKDQIAKSQA
jgi:hypothetical protein